MATYEDIHITKAFLDSNPNVIFVFGDNLQRFSTGGAAFLRNHSQSYGFVTKKAPNNFAESFFQPEEYSGLFFEELKKLKEQIVSHPTTTFYVSKLGAGLANKNFIWEKLVRHNLVKELEDLDNVVFCWNPKSF